MTRTQTQPANPFIRSVFFGEMEKSVRLKELRIQLNQSDWWFHHSNNVRIQLMTHPFLPLNNAFSLSVTSFLPQKAIS
jgi:hypothetical protein